MGSRGKEHSARDPDEGVRKRGRLIPDDDEKRPTRRERDEAEGRSLRSIYPPEIPTVRRRDADEGAAQHGAFYNGEFLRKPSVSREGDESASRVGERGGRPEPAADRERLAREVRDLPAVREMVLAIVLKLHRLDPAALERARGSLLGKSRRHRRLQQYLTSSDTLEFYRARPGIERLLEAAIAAMVAAVTEEDVQEAAQRADEALQLLETSMPNTWSEFLNGLADDQAPVPATAAVEEDPLFPGLARPWTQIRGWSLDFWIQLILTLLTLALTVAQFRSQGSFSLEDCEQIIRIVYDAGGPNNTPPGTGTTTPPTGP